MGGAFNVKRFFDPLGLTIGKGQGSIANAWDPAGIFDKGDNAQAQAIESAPVPTPAPAVSPNSTAVMQAERDYAQRNLLKKSVRKTIVAGDTGGYQPNNPNPPIGPTAGYKPGRG